MSQTILIIDIPLLAAWIAVIAGLLALIGSILWMIGSIGSILTRPAVIDSVPVLTVAEIDTMVTNAMDSRRADIVRALKS